MLNVQELASDFQQGRIIKELVYAVLPTKLSSGKWIWLQNYFELVYIKNEIKDHVKAKVSFTEMIDIQHVSTQGSPESKGAGGGYNDVYEYQPRRKRSFLTEQEENELRNGEWGNDSNSRNQSNSVKKQLKNYEQMKASILENIIGQNQIIDEMMKKIIRRDFKLSTDKRKPLSFFWAGPTGVGKTETALQLGKITNMTVVRIDMSEYTHDHNISRLIGSPPGYVGFNQPGILQECDGQECIILIDEIEKAHQLVYNIFLQVLDYGILTDGRNRQIDLSKSIIIMTSNVGAREMNETKIGLNQQVSNEEKKATVFNAMKKTFSPEFINRLSSVLVFNSLELSVIENIVKMNVNKVLTAVEKEHGVKVELSEELKSAILKKAYDPLMGVRPIHRAIESLIIEPLSEKIMNQKQTGVIKL